MIDEMIVRLRPNNTEMRKPLNQARDHVAALIVGAEPVIFEIAAAVQSVS